MNEDKIKDRFWRKVKKLETGCWEWQGSIITSGYGHFWDGSRWWVAHRFAYEKIYNYPIPKGLEIDHLCRNKICVNPAHLDVVTRSENTKRGLLPSIVGARQRGKTHCPYGHPYDEVNTYAFPNGRRGCRTCMRKSTQNWREKCKVKLQQ